MTMTVTMEELRFYGMINIAFERKTGAMLPGSEAETFLSGIREEYVAAGSPTAARKWVENALEKVVLSVADMPCWIESIKPRWPFHKGRPMIYLGNVVVPDTPVAEEHASPSVHLLIFGIRVQVEGGWSMVYTVVDQHPDL